MFTYPLTELGNVPNPENITISADAGSQTLTVEGNYANLFWVVNLIKKLVSIFKYNIY